MYIVIDRFNYEYPFIINKEEGSDKAAMYDTYQKAQDAAYEEAQDGIVVNYDGTSDEHGTNIVLDLLLSMDMALNPELYKSTAKLTPDDFLDLAESKALSLGITEEFNSFRSNNPDYTSPTAVIAEADEKRVIAPVNTSLPEHIRLLVEARDSLSMDAYELGEEESETDTLVDEIQAYLTKNNITQ